MLLGHFRRFGRSHPPSAVAEPCRRCLARHLADFQAEAAQDSPNAQFHVQQPSEKLPDLVQDWTRCDNGDRLAITTHYPGWQAR